MSVDVGDDTLMEARSWRWLETRILGLFARPLGHDLAGNPIFTSRVQQHFAPAPADPIQRDADGGPSHLSP